MIDSLDFTDHTVQTISLPTPGDVNVVPVFVYGSLRPEGNGAHSMMTDGSIAGPFPAYMAARLYYHTCGAYPVLDVDDPTTLTRGDVYLMDVDSRHWEWVYRMELGAGYDADWRTAYMLQGGRIRQSEVVVFGWHLDYRGPEVTTGDWLTASWAEWPTEVK